MCIRILPTRNRVLYNATGKRFAALTAVVQRISEQLRWILGACLPNSLSDFFGLTPIGVRIDRAVRVMIDVEKNMASQVRRR